MSQSDDKHLLEIAVRLFLQLEDAPDNAEFIAERDAFLAKGQAERDAYQKAVAGWKATGIKPRKNILGIAVLVAALGAGALYVAEPLRIAWMADISTRFETAQDNLKSGDVVFLDAATAITDATDPDAEVRSVTLLQGGAFFDVTQDERLFRVNLGEITVEVIGTAFETSLLDDRTSVDVAEGIVRVIGPTQSWQLEAGERLEWSQSTGGRVTDITPTLVATWRQDQLVAENMRVSDIASILDRRIAGDVMIIGSDLANKTVSGNFDLSDPIGALQVLAATQNARLVPGRPFVTLLVAR